MADNEIGQYAREFGLTASAEHRLNNANLAASDDGDNPFAG
jgi:phage terminase small subunit